MRIFHPITRLVRGGAQLNTLMCAEEQVRRGHRVVVASGIEAGPEGSYLEQARQGSFEFIEVPSLVREVDPHKDLQALSHLYRIVRDQPFDLIHTHTSKAGILGRWAAWLAGYRAIVHTPHGNVFYGYFSPARERVFRWLERLTGLITSRMVMLSEGDRNDHLRAGVCPDDRLVIIPSGVPVERFAGPATEQERHRAEELGIPPGRLAVGTVARLVPVKGLGDLVEAFHTVRQRIPEALLVLVGDGTERARLEQQVTDLGLGAEVLFTGRLDDVVPVLKRLDLFVMASHNEGMGRAVVEALAAGVPVVATRVGGLPDVVGPEVGRLVEARSPQSLAQAIVDLLQDEQGLQRMRQAAPARASEFSDAVMFERLERLYQEVLAGRR